MFRKRSSVPKSITDYRVGDEVTGDETSGGEITDQRVGDDLTGDETSVG